MDVYKHRTFSQLPAKLGAGAPWRAGGCPKSSRKKLVGEIAIGRSPARRVRAVEHKRSCHYRNVLLHCLANSTNVDHVRLEAEILAGHHIDACSVASVVADEVGEDANGRVRVVVLSRYLRSISNAVTSEVLLKFATPAVLVERNARQTSAMLMLKFVLTRRTLLPVSSSNSN